MRRILHICQDEKFIDGAIYLFNKAFPTQNKFLVILSPAISKPNYIKSKEKNIRSITQTRETISYLTSFILDFDIIILHGLNVITAELLVKSPHKNKFLWSVLGAEIYHNKLLYTKPLLATKTSLLANTIDANISIKERVKNVYRKIRYGKIQTVTNPHELIVQAANQVEHFGSLLEEEFDYLQSKGALHSKAVFQPLSYYPIEYFSNTSSSTPSVGTNLLIGNSASYTNNHIELFELLKTLDTEERKIIVPLSYGNKKYQKEIIKVGKKLFGHNFIPLVKFMPLKEYNKTIQSCGIIIMNHYRQQGVGNIVQSLWQGRKLYLSEHNLLYNYFNRIGCKIFSIEKELNKANTHAFDPLSKEEIDLNRSVLKHEISEKSLVNKLQTGLLNFN